MRGISMILVMSLFISIQAFGEEPDCVYAGRGEVYDFDGNHLSDKSFDLHLERFRIAPSQYHFIETKTFSDGTKSKLNFAMGWFIGNFSFDDKAGRIVKGRCLDFGYCVGKNHFPGFEGTFVTRFDDQQILTTTTTNELIVDEFVRPATQKSCPFN